jgi:hypothetical protein
VLGAGKLLLKVNLVSDGLLCCVSDFSMLFDIRLLVYTCNSVDILAYNNCPPPQRPPSSLAIILCFLGCFPLETMLSFCCLAFIRVLTLATFAMLGI